MDDNRQYVINDDIEKYKAEVVKGLTAHQVKNAVIVAFIALVSFLFFHSVCYVPLSLSSFMTILTALPVVVIVFFKVEGMDMPEFLRRMWFYEFGGGYGYKGDSFRKYNDIAGAGRTSDISGAERKGFSLRRKKTNTSDDEAETYFDENIRKELLIEKYKAAKELLYKTKKEDDDMGFSDELNKLKKSLPDKPYQESGMAGIQAESPAHVSGAETYEDDEADQELIEKTKDAERIMMENLRNYLEADMREYSHGSPVNEIHQAAEEVTPEVTVTSDPVSCDKSCLSDMEDSDEDYEETAVLGRKVIKGKVFCLTDTTGKHYILNGCSAVGRNKKSDIVIKGNNTVSNNHAVITVNGDAVLVKDVGSRNGTFIDGKRIQEGFDIAVRPESELKFSNAVFKVEILGESNEI